MLSESVANAFHFRGLSGTQQTEKFVRIFNKFFDCLNVRSFREAIVKRKPDLQVYKSPDDVRLEVQLNIVA